jgi:hypothetical protein
MAFQLAIMMTEPPVCNQDRGLNTLFAVPITRPGAVNLILIGIGGLFPCRSSMAMDLGPGDCIPVSFTLGRTNG